MQHIFMLGFSWPELYIHSVCTVTLAGKCSNMQYYTVYLTNVPMCVGLARTIYIYTLYMTVNLLISLPKYRI
jgi:hypothetical protein